MNQTTRQLTRRRFLEMVGKVGGSAALYETMTALGLINIPEAWAGPPQLPPGAGEGKTVLILGAGIGGLTAAYMLTQANYRCQILEAQDRAGGRSLTARRGTVIIEENQGRRTRQVCDFDDDLYLNMGPGRLPYHHRRVLYYCQELGVPLEVYVMETTANLFQTDAAFNRQAIPRRRIASDTQGYIAELLAKAIRKNALDQELTEEDREKLLCLLKVYGDLGQDMEMKCSKCGKISPACQSCYGDPGNCTHCLECSTACPECFRYFGSTRSGCRDHLTVYTPCEPSDPLKLQDLLNSQFWQYRFYQPLEYEWQPTLFQPVGGMDKIVDGFKRKIGHLIKYQTEVLEIRLQPDGVEVTYLDGWTKERGHLRADYCVSSIPLPVLKGTSLLNFSDDFKWAINRGRFASTCKLGWQANKRFWESDQYQIYGGISYTDDMITQMWYPSNDYFSGKGTLTGVYNYDEDAIQFGQMPLPERITTARRGAAKLHPEFNDERIVPTDKALSIAWQNIPFQRGGWADWKADDSDDQKAYTRLLAPDGKFFVVGDQVSTLPGWQEGAMMSAEHVVLQIGGLQPLTVPQILRAPNTRRLVQGRF
jgi:monoamine oxidase